MNRTLLPVALMNAQSELDGVLEEFLLLPSDVEQHLAICDLYRKIAIGSLLLTADPRSFYVALFDSTRTLLHAVENAPKEQLLTSRALPFFDAVACRDSEAATRFASQFPADHDDSREYEEDFLYVRVMMDIYLGADPTGIDARLARFAELAEANPDPRQLICAALHARGSFDEALDGAIEACGEEIATAMDDESMDADDAALSPVSIEALAWIELAHRQGIESPVDVPFAPEIARAFHVCSFPSAQHWRGTNGRA